MAGRDRRIDMGGVRELRARMARGARRGERGMTLLEIMIFLRI